MALEGTPSVHEMERKHEAVVAPASAVADDVVRVL
jgi:hypothetical protein